MRRILPLLVLLLAISAGCPKPEPTLQAKARSSLQKGLDFLVQRQSEDGAWRSKTNEALRDGYGLTPIVLKALIYTPERKHPEAVARGREFLANLGPAQDLSFPIYILAGTCMVVEEKEPWVARIREFQMVETLDWSPEDIEFGGWSEALSPPRRPEGEEKDRPSVANVSATLFGLGALRLSGVAPEDPAVKKALGFVEKCQNFPEDGGFVYSPNRFQHNKAGQRVSYGTATADGLRALRACGLPEDNPRVQAARKWLEDHFDATQVAGAFPEDKERRRNSLYYYYCWTVAHALGRYPTEHKTWARELAQELIRLQSPEGHWVNPVPGMTEDEPIVATTFAVSALSLCLPHLEESK